MVQAGTDRTPFSTSVNCRRVTSAFPIPCISPAYRKIPSGLHSIRQASSARVSSRRRQIPPSPRVRVSPWVFHRFSEKTSAYRKNASSFTAITGGSVHIRFSASGTICFGTGRIRCRFFSIRFSVCLSVLFSFSTGIIPPLPGKRKRIPEIFRHFSYIFFPQLFSFR